MAESNDGVMDAFADVSERLVEYAAVWRTAIERNAKSNYQADDFLVDLQTLWGMSVRDAARITSAVLAACTPSDANKKDNETPPDDANKRQNETPPDVPPAS
jgi:hypothetical protein